ncbi:alpha/beta fold hydrolase [Deinococcus cellulosilyticus]|uniref:Homoserine O-acetyltransferase n=1 Tax=Deinococcus cellulosilyticus (strain DSM 18568 / NBRC 106333 / KACC 11606 / 5516J-15) TaxID=1223518 RepID=A0A511N2T6_DEIC1|nr:alpha/beta fold hydrolase [Deinococcus cellulosilyticus]GEM47165.1 homoserine O-acetyltransferase [Deinococcus cellulosilyticus NBRC 106333 = KACC 11606]
MQTGQGVLRVVHTFEAGSTLPLSLGYETYGELRPERDNAILVCHYYTGTMHAAGAYPEDGLTGWWDPLIGDGKSIDTRKFFVVCMNAPANVQVKDPRIIASGPETEPDFPTVDLKDITRLQFQLMQKLGISRWHAVLGPSYGAMQTLMWGALYPQHLQRLGVIAGSPQAGIALRHFFTPVLKHLARTEEGLHEALRLITFCGLGSDGMEVQFDQVDVDAYISGRKHFASLKHILSVGETVSRYDIFKHCPLDRITRNWLEQGIRVLSVNILGDQFFPSRPMKVFAGHMQEAGVNHQHLEIECQLGHLGCVYETEKFERAIRELLD